MSDRGRKFSPGGWFSTIGGGLGLSAGLFPPLAPLVVPIGVVGWGAGLALDYAAYLAQSPEVRAHVRSMRALRDKLLFDFRDSILLDRVHVEQARRVVTTRLVRAGLAKTGDPRFNCGDDLDGLWRYLAPSACWEGRPLAHSADLVRAFGPVTVSNVTIHAGLEAALMIMTEDYGLPLDILPSFPNGVRQAEAINGGCEADVAMLSDVNMFAVAGASRARAHTLYLPIFWQRQYVVRHIGLRAFDKSHLYFATSSCAEEQLRLGSAVARMFPTQERTELDMDDVPHKLAALHRGEAVIAWRPTVSMLCAPGSGLEAREAQDYRLSTSIYFGAGLLAESPAEVRFAFLDCLIGAWNLARIYAEEAALRLLLRKGYRGSFRFAGDGIGRKHADRNVEVESEDESSTLPRRFAA